jgi:hypothetical protein
LRGSSSTLVEPMKRYPFVPPPAEPPVRRPGSINDQRAFFFKEELRRAGHPNDGKARDS